MGSQSSNPSSLYSSSYGYYLLIPSMPPLIQKHYHIPSLPQRNSFLALLSLLKHTQCETLLQIQNIAQNQSTIKVKFEYLQKTLQDEIKERVQQGRKFRETEILSFLDCGVSAMIAMEYQGLVKKKWGVEGVWIREKDGEKKYVVSYLELDDGEGGESTESKDKRQKFVSPQELADSPITQKSSIFSLALLTLHLCLLSSISSIYISSSISQYNLSSLLSALATTYSSSIISLLGQMLTLPHSSRISLSQTSTFLRQLIEKESELRYRNSASKIMTQRVVGEREKELEERGIDGRLPTYCYVVEKEWMGQLYGGRGEGIFESGLKESRRSRI